VSGHRLLESQKSSQSHDPAPSQNRHPLSRQMECPTHHRTASDSTSLPTNDNIESPQSFENEAYPRETWELTRERQWHRTHCKRRKGSSPSKCSSLRIHLKKISKPQTLECLPRSTPHWKKEILSRHSHSQSHMHHTPSNQNHSTKLSR
jgi:hypothetical protein